MMHRHDVERPPPFTPPQLRPAADRSDERHVGTSEPTRRTPHELARNFYIFKHNADADGEFNGPDRLVTGCKPLDRNSFPERAQGYRHGLYVSLTGFPLPLLVGRRPASRRFVGGSG
jgi:hypothetical protein